MKTILKAIIECPSMLIETGKDETSRLKILVVTITLLVCILILVSSKPQPEGISTAGYAYVEAHEQYVLYRKESTGELYMFVRSITSPGCFIANFKLAEDAATGCSVGRKCNATCASTDKYTGGGN